MDIQKGQEMKMSSFCFVLRMNDVNPMVFFDKIPDGKMTEIQSKIHKALTTGDAQVIINEYK